MYKNELIKNLHSLYREDPWLNELFETSGLTLDEFEKVLLDAVDQLTISKATWGLRLWEEALNVKTSTKTTLEDRRAFIRAKWISDQKCDIKLIQNICNAWKNGEVKVTFKDKIQLTFNGEYGIPTDLGNLKKAIEDIKPAHLMLEYFFNYLLVKDVTNMKIKDLQAKKIDEFAFISKEGRI